MSKPGCCKRKNRRESNKNLQKLVEWGSSPTEKWKINSTKFRNLENFLKELPRDRLYPGRIFFHFVNPFSNDFRRGMQPDSGDPEDYKISQYLKTEPNYETCTWGRLSSCHSDIIKCLNRGDVVFGVARVRYGDHEFLKKDKRDRVEHFLTWILTVDEKKRIRREKDGKEWNAFVFREDRSFLCLPPRIMMTMEILEKLSSNVESKDDGCFGRFLKKWREQRQKETPDRYYSTYASAFAQYFHGGPKLNMAQVNTLMETIKSNYDV